MLTINEIYKTINMPIPEGMNGDHPAQAVDHTKRNAQGDIKMYTRNIAKQCNLNFASGEGEKIEKSLIVVKGEATRNNHELILDVDSEAFWNPEPNTRTDLEEGILTVTKGQVFLYHTAEHDPFVVTPKDGQVLFTRTREMGEEIRKQAD